MEARRSFTEVRDITVAALPKVESSRSLATSQLDQIGVYLPNLQGSQGSQSALLWSDPSSWCAGHHCSPQGHDRACLLPVDEQPGCVAGDAVDQGGKRVDHKRGAHLRGKRRRALASMGPSLSSVPGGRPLGYPRTSTSTSSPRRGFVSEERLRAICPSPPPHTRHDQQVARREVSPAEGEEAAGQILAEEDDGRLDEPRQALLQAGTGEGPGSAPSHPRPAVYVSRPQQRAFAGRYRRLCKGWCGQPNSPCIGRPRPGRPRP